jgi:hypothetical protein
MTSSRETRTFDAPGLGHPARCLQMTHQTTARTLHPHHPTHLLKDPAKLSSSGCRDTGALSIPDAAGGPPGRLR